MAKLYEQQSYEISYSVYDETIYNKYGTETAEILHKYILNENKAFLCVCTIFHNSWGKRTLEG